MAPQPAREEEAKPTLTQLGQMPGLQFYLTLVVCDGGPFSDGAQSPESEKRNKPGPNYDTVN